MTFDEARAAFPRLGMAVYAYDPPSTGSGLVTLEVISPDGETFTFTGPTLQAALDQAFPPEPPPMMSSVFD